jgi:hypothetical protein
LPLVYHQATAKNAHIDYRWASISVYNIACLGQDPDKVTIRAQEDSPRDVSEYKSIVTDGDPKGRLIGLGKGVRECPNGLGHRCKLTTYAVYGDRGSRRQGSHIPA